MAVLHLNLVRTATERDCLDLIYLKSKISVGEQKQSLGLLECLVLVKKKKGAYPSRNWQLSSISHLGSQHSESSCGELRKCLVWSGFLFQRIPLPLPCCSSCHQCWPGLPWDHPLFSPWGGSLSLTQLQFPPQHWKQQSSALQTQGAQDFASSFTQQSGQLRHVGNQIGWQQQRPQDVKGLEQQADKIPGERRKQGAQQLGKKRKNLIVTAMTSLEEAPFSVGYPGFCNHRCLFSFLTHPTKQTNVMSYKIQVQAAVFKSIVVHMRNSRRTKWYPRQDQAHC